MPLMLECPAGHRLKVPRKMAGFTIVCPVCEARVAVPPLSTQKKEAETPSVPTEAPPKHTPDIQPPLAAANSIHSRAEDSEREPTLASDNAKSFESEPLADSTSVSGESTIVQLGEDERNGAGHLDLKSPPAASAVPLNFDPQGLASLERDQTKTLQEDISPSTSPTNGTAPILEATEEANQSYKDDPFSPAQLKLISDTAEPTSNPTWIVIDTDPYNKSTIHGGPPTGIKPTRQHLGVFWLAVAAILVAVISSCPPILQHITARQVGGLPDSWTYVVLLSSLIQIGVAVLALCIPDWSTQWIGAIATTGFAAFYALGLALTMFANQDHQLVRELGLLDEAFRNQAQPWCFLIMCLTLILAFCHGRYSVRWYHAEHQLGASGLT